MRMLNICLLNVIRRSFFQLAAQRGTKRAVFLIQPSSVNTCRTFVLSTWLNKNSLEDTTEKLDLDGWKNIMRTTVQEEISEGTSDVEEDPNVVAVKELIEVLRLTSKEVPENINEEHFKKLLECRSVSARKKYLAFLTKKEHKKKANKIKKEIKRAERKTLNIEQPENKLIKRVWGRSEDTVYNWRVAQSMIFGQPLVYDMNYEDEMSEREMQNAVKQMMECEAFNRRTKDPFHLHYCSLATDGLYHKEFVKRYGEAWNKLLVTVSEKPYTEIFPRDQLVYLTADSPHIMKKFDHDKIYIIGGFVDKKIKSGVSYARAKRLNLATARLPLDVYLDWQCGPKNLTLNQMLLILLALKDTGDWKEALKFVPGRKHSGFVGASLTETELWNEAKKHEKNAHKEKSDFAASFLKRPKKHKWYPNISS